MSRNKNKNRKKYAKPCFRALGHRFLLFLRNSEKLRDDYDLAVAIIGPPQLANRSHLIGFRDIHLSIYVTYFRYSYELRLFDEAGFAYRGPMLSAATPFNQFWTQVCKTYCIIKTEIK